MPRMKASDKLLKDAKAAATAPVTFGMEIGEIAIDDAHTLQNSAFHTGSIYLRESIHDDEAR